MLRTKISGRTNVAAFHLDNFAFDLAEEDENFSHSFHKAWMGTTANK